VEDEEEKLASVLLASAVVAPLRLLLQLL